MKIQKIIDILFDLKILNLMYLTKNMTKINPYRLNSSRIFNTSTLASVEINVYNNNFQQFLISNNFLKSNSQLMKNIKIISHRGRSDIFPQNTLQSISEALITSDLAQFDVMLTKDNQVIVFHDRFLGELTNIAELEEFKDRRTINNLNQYGQKPHLEWWTKDFTLEQIKKLKVKQKHLTRPQIIEKQFKIPTLNELLSKALQVKSTQDKSNNSGLLLQIKTERQSFTACERDIILLQKINQCFKQHNLQNKQKCQGKNLPIIVQAFNHEALNIFHQINKYTTLVHLYSEEDEKVNEEYLAKHRTAQSLGVAVSTKHMTRDFVQMCRRMKYQVFYWSVMDDKPQIPLGHKSYQQFYKFLHLMNIDGIITDFANNCKNALFGVILNK